MAHIDHPARRLEASVTRLNATGTFPEGDSGADRAQIGTQVSGPDALAGVLAQFEGFEAPAAAWESEILPARVSGYEISWLDDLCLAGRIVWTRLRAPATRPDEADAARPRTSAGPVRATPIGLHPVDLAPDGKRFAILPQDAATNEPGSVHATFLLNFFDELHRRLP